MCAVRVSQNLYAFNENMLKIKKNSLLKQIFVKNDRIGIYFAKEWKWVFENRFKCIILHLEKCTETPAGVRKLPHQLLETWGQFAANQNIVENSYNKPK